MATYTGTARYFTNREDENFTLFEGFREFQIISDDPSFEVGETDFTFVDTTLGVTVDIEDTEFGLFRFETGGVERAGVFLELSGRREGEDNPGFFNDEPDINFTYRILAEGDDLPPLEQFEAIDVQYPALGIEAIDLDDVGGDFEQWSEGETVRFQDISSLEGPGLGLSVEEAQTVALLYEAAFDRRAEAAGLNYWIDQREAGLSEVALAQEFIVSDEFQLRYGDPELLQNDEFVEQLYLNVLERSPDATGDTFWTNELASGALDRNEVLLAFAESPENFEQAEFIGNLREVEEGTWDFFA